ncbi:MAG: UDP-3-O-[3-hydroxymyristoyl] N-acetylglucosamine deacetylase [Deltaproteobacteria bacterium]|nr:MAG: UDP-3-O-[3-hydroxymyristoyl] N-acetylglucosamine deacetylase [Deltaproteobacteria bacterium]
MSCQNKDKYYQHTLKKEIHFKGKGVHSGKDVSMVIKPAPPNSGINFFRSDLSGYKSVKAIFKNVTDTSLATVIGNGDFIISTIEHLMAAFSGLQIDNGEVYLDNYELPIMDGSAFVFTEKFLRAGKKQQKAARHFIEITSPVELSEGDTFVGVYPDNKYNITCSIEFKNPVIGKQVFSTEIIPENFVEEISRARTFGFMSDVEAMNLLGLGRGGSLESAVVIDEDTILNPDGLRYENEFVRHKLLDCIGDFALIGMPLLGHIKTSKSGHLFHNKFLHFLFSQKDSWRTRSFV